jgi:hypothetical protein
MGIACFIKKPNGKTELLAGQRNLGCDLHLSDRMRRTLAEGRCLLLKRNKVAVSNIVGLSHTITRNIKASSSQYIDA